MPLYVRKCASCGYESEGLERTTAKEVIECPSCNRITFSKQATSSNFEIKGASYRNGYE